MKNLIKKQDKELNKIFSFGTFSDRTIKSIVSKVRKETAEYVANEMILPNVQTGTSEYCAVDLYRKEQLKIKKQITTI